MKIQDPLQHWNNFPVFELKQILKHCKALDRLGIVQDEEMMASIERDITLRRKKTSPRNAPFEAKFTKTKQQPREYLLEQTV